MYKTRQDSSHHTETQIYTATALLVVEEVKISRLEVQERLVEVGERLLEGAIALHSNNIHPLHILLNQVLQARDHYPDIYWIQHLQNMHHTHTHHLKSISYTPFQYRLQAVVGKGEVWWEVVMGSVTTDRTFPQEYNNDSLFHVHHIPLPHQH